MPLVSLEIHLLLPKSLEFEGWLENFMNGLGGNVDQGGPAVENHETQRMVGAGHGEEPESLNTPPIMVESVGTTK